MALLKSLDEIIESLNYVRSMFAAWNRTTTRRFLIRNVYKRQTFGLVDTIQRLLEKGSLWGCCFLHWRSVWPKVDPADEDPSSLTLFAA